MKDRNSSFKKETRTSAGTVVLNYAETDVFVPDEPKRRPRNLSETSSYTMCSDERLQSTGYRFGFSDANYRGFPIT